jgi:hypothetical protein
VAAVPWVVGCPVLVSVACLALSPFVPALRDVHSDPCAAHLARDALATVEGREGAAGGRSRRSASRSAERRGGPVSGVSRLIGRGSLFARPPRHRLCRTLSRLAGHPDGLDRARHRAPQRGRREGGPSCWRGGRFSVCALSSGEGNAPPPSKPPPPRRLGPAHPAHRRIARTAAHQRQPRADQGAGGASAFRRSRPGSFPLAGGAVASVSAAGAWRPARLRASRLLRWASDPESVPRVRLACLWVPYVRLMVRRDPPWQRPKKNQRNDASPDRPRQQGPSAGRHPERHRDLAVPGWVLWRRASPAP